MKPRSRTFTEGDCQRVEVIMTLRLKLNSGKVHVRLRRTRYTDLTVIR